MANESDRQSASAFDISVSSFSVEVISTERIDHTWIALAYGESLLLLLPPQKTIIPNPLKVTADADAKFSDANMRV